MKNQKTPMGLKVASYAFTILVLGLLAYQWIQNGKNEQKVERLEQHAPIFEMTPDSTILIKGEELEHEGAKDVLLQMVEITKNANKVWLEYKQDTTIRCVQCQFITGIDKETKQPISIRADSIRYYQSYFEPSVGTWIAIKE